MHSFCKGLFISLCIAAVISAGHISAEAAVPIESTAQYEAQISFFRQALDEFGAVCPDQAVRLWARGDETRNGVYKYAVAGPELQRDLAKRWGAPQNNFWIIGVSSPWLSHYDIESKAAVSPSEIKYTVKYYWQTSSGPAAPTAEQLYVTLSEGIWSIKKVIPLG